MFRSPYKAPLVDSAPWYDRLYREGDANHAVLQSISWGTSKKCGPIIHGAGTASALFPDCQCRSGAQPRTRYAPSIHPAYSHQMNQQCTFGTQPVCTGWTPNPAVPTSISWVAADMPHPPRLLSSDKQMCNHAYQRLPEDENPHNRFFWEGRWGFPKNRVENRENVRCSPHTRRHMSEGHVMLTW